MLVTCFGCLPHVKMLLQHPHLKPPLIQKTELTEVTVFEPRLDEEGLQDLVSSFADNCGNFFGILLFTACFSGVNII